MKLQKAKEILDLNLKEAGKKMPPDVYQALALGIEALKRIQAFDTYPRGGSRMPLPGETED